MLPNKDEGRMRAVVAAWVVLWICGAGLPAFGNPVWGEPWKLRQPDGAMVEVRIWGDEFYQVVESPDGWTLVRDPRTQVICYARVSADGQSLVSTGTAAGRGNPAALGLQPHARVNAETARARAQAAREAFDREAETARPAAGAPVQPAMPTGDVLGLCLIVDFPDEAGTIAPATVWNYLNQVGYSANGNNGSVHDYFYDVSNNLLNYTNTVPPAYYRAKKNKTYYDDGTLACGPRARELIEEALNDLKASGFDFAPYDNGGDDRMEAINCFYAGTTSSGWAMGLWPHKGSALNFSDDGVEADSYQISGMGGSLKLGTFCHENGHLVCGFPDLYDYDYDSSGVGNFCLMCSGGSGGNPVRVCAPLRNSVGWITPVALTTPQTGLTLPVSTVYQMVNPLPLRSNEYYMIENRRKSGRDANIADNGMAIWHYHAMGSNNWQQRTRTSHYKVALMQADGEFDLEGNRGADNTDLFAAPEFTEFTPFTTPMAHWWDGELADLCISNISASQATMTFDFGIGGLTVSDAKSFEPHGPKGGPFLDSTKTYTLTNHDAAPVNWTADKTQAWLDVSPSGGVLAGGASADIDLSLNAAAAGLAANVFHDTVRIRNTATGRELGRAVELFVQKFAALPFTEDFETGLGQAWHNTGTKEWRIRWTTDYTPHAGVRHLVMDDWDGGDNRSRNEATLGVNVSRHGDCLLTFWAKQFRDEHADGPPPSPFTDGEDFDGVAISVDGATWWEVLPLRNISENWTQYTVDLDSQLAARGLPHSPVLRIRFNQCDLGPADNNRGIAIDDIAVTGATLESARHWEKY